MAKSSRSKWKKLHRRQKAKEESTNTVKRIQQLHKKLELTIKGGISAVPPQEPETRFHFLNPELDPRVPNTRKDLNNNYRAELNHVHYDYTKPLQLVPSKTNLYGKTDTAAPHPMTRHFETIDADAPLGGHALTKADVERMARRQTAKEAEEAARVNEEVSADDHAGADRHGSDGDSDGPEEFVFGMDDAAPRRAGKTSSKKLTTPLSKKARGSAAPKAKKSSGSSSGTSAAVAALVAAAEEDVDDEMLHHHGGNTKANKITSMQAVHKKNGVTVSAGGMSKMKKVGSQGGASGTRVVSSGGKAAQKKTGNKNFASK